MHTTIYQTGFIVATADDVYGEWTAQFLKDKNGEDLNVPMWDDPCPYWEFNEDGTLKNAYLIASKLKGTESGNSAWYPHVFQMSLDGLQLLDGDKTYMSMPGDQTRVRNEQGELVDEDGNVIPSGKGYGQNYAHAMNDDGTLPTVLDAIQLPGREGTVVRDIQSAEASKIVTFGADTAIGQTTFSGRHGENEKVSDYIYWYMGICAGSTPAGNWRRHASTGSTSNGCWRIGKRRITALLPGSAPGVAGMWWRICSTSLSASWKAWGKQTTKQCS